MAIAASDPLREHLALLERLIVIGLFDVAYLPVGKKELALERRYPMRIGQPAARHPILGEHAAPRVAETAGFNLGTQERRRHAALWLASLRILRPRDVRAFVESNHKPLRPVLALAERPPACLIVRPCDMARARPVTGLATDADLAPGC